MQKQYRAKSQFYGPRPTVLAGLMVLVASYSAAFAQTAVFSSITELDLPAGPGAQEPSIFPMDDGRILMSWTEPAAEGFAVKTAIGNATGWTKLSIPD